MSRKKVFTIVAVLALVVTGVAIAATNDPEIKGTSTQLDYSATLDRTQNCLNRNGSTTGDKLLTFSLNGNASAGEDPELNGTFKARVKELVDSDHDRIAGGVYSITNPSNGPRTFGAFGAVDRESGDTATLPNTVLDSNALQGFTIGRATSGSTSRLLLGNLTLNIPDGGGSGLKGRIGREDAAGDDAVLLSGFCDTDHDGDDDFHAEHSFG